jgi:hypothetical protein
MLKLQKENRETGGNVTLLGEGRGIWKTFGLLIAGTHAVIQTLKKWWGE